MNLHNFSLTTDKKYYPKIKLTFYDIIKPRVIVAEML